LTKELKKRGYTVGLLDSKTVADVLEDIDKVGKLTGRTKQAEELVFQLRERRS
jgi:ABC-type Fe3+-hydroxamate transport system substrate-binding protein